jgi:lysophospholipase L1-like esterase
MKPTSQFLRLTLCIFITVIAAVTASAEPVFTPKTDDLWVMAGDSITAQRLHTNYIEAFYRTRYPNLNLQFRNSGIGGNRTGNIIARFDYDVAAWKPTIVSIELGMNDVSGGDDPAAYVKGMRDLIKKIRDAKAQPVLISSSPVNDGSLPGKWTSDRCRRIDLYTNALNKLATEEGVVCVDQYHPLLELWGRNNPVEASDTVATPSSAPAGAKDAKKKGSTGIIQLHGDAVHTGPVGQYTMAATILAALNVDREVSSATLKADGTVVEAKRCKISDASANGGKLSFSRLDECSPWPIDPKSKDAVALLPAIADLSHYMLTVGDLPAGRYEVTIDGKPAATLTEKQLGAGWNMSTVFEGALADRSNKINALIATLQGKLNNDWRAASKEKNTEKLAAAQKAIDESESEVKAACQPALLHFEIQPAK